MEVHGLIDKYLEFQDRLLYHHGREAIAIFVILAALLFIFFGYASTRLWTPSPPLAPAKKVQTIAGETTSPVATGDSYFCNGGKNIHVQFSAAQVNIKLSDGRKVALPALSGVEVSQVGASGLERYSSADGSFIFLTNRKTAFVSENGIATYVNCAVR